MDRIEFLTLRIAALEQSIHMSKKMIGLCEIANGVDVKTQKADMFELQRRIRMDKELLAARQTELG